MVNVKRLLSETLIYGIGAILPRVITFLLNPLYIHYIDKQAFAVFTSLYAWIAFVNIVLTFGFETAYFRFAAVKNIPDQPVDAQATKQAVIAQESRVFNTAFWFVAGLASTFLISVLWLNQPLANVLDYGANPEFVRWMAWIAFFDALCMLPFAWLRFYGYPVRYSLVRVMAIVLQTAVVIALFTVVPPSIAASLGLTAQVAYPFYANLLASIATFVMLLPIVARVRLRFDRVLFRQMIAYSYPVMLAGLAFMVNENFDKIIQYYLIDKADAGAYGGCYKLAVLMTLFVTAYRMGIEPFLFKQMQSADAKQTYARMTEYFALFASVVALAIIANIGWLKRLFITDASYWTAIGIVPIIVIANLCFGIYYNLSTWYKVTDRTLVGSAISWVGAGLTIILHLLLLSRFGFMASAWITLAVYAAMMVISYALGQRFYPIAYRVKKVGALLAAMVVASVLVVWSDYAFWWSNALLIAYMVLLGYTERKLLLPVWAKIKHRLPVIG
ncbi:lipopolysaccharide biosynthesis protein [Faucicola atlantae]|uniref:Polysaccharide biosynthesis protein n=1 Tax=Faucicola atlantae TaxID=34059 RepID=A0A1B8Q9S0_9GAMM|nr:oligosaccharide flippase family protein [Moraxella atlantae]OBX75804.1 polysaccharide biosynthesis protein [Moraxella atlantae]